MKDMSKKENKFNQLEDHPRLKEAFEKNLSKMYKINYKVNRI